MEKGDKMAPYFCMIFFTEVNLSPLLFDFPILSRILTLTTAGTTGSSLAGSDASV
jgi:hypothetical protein